MSSSLASHTAAIPALQSNHTCCIKSSCHRSGRRNGADRVLERKRYSVRSESSNNYNVGAGTKCPAPPLRAQVVTMIPLKKLIRVRLFVNRSSLASTAACPQPTTLDDWARHAMDTARLAHISSIRDAVNIFTQMLQQLQVGSIVRQCSTALREPGRALSNHDRDREPY